MVLHELFFLSRSFPARVRAQVHVRSELDALPFAPLFFSGPFPLFSGPFGGIRFALCQDSLQFVTARALEKGARFTFLQVPCFRCPAGQPQSLLHRAPPPGYFCLLSFAARPTVRASVLPSAWPRLRLRHQRPHSMGFSIAPGSAQFLPCSLCRLPDFE